MHYFFKNANILWSCCQICMTEMPVQITATHQQCAMQIASTATESVAMINFEMSSFSC
jgi:hypothetical protein